METINDSIGKKVITPNDDIATIIRIESEYTGSFYKAVAIVEYGDGAQDGFYYAQLRFVEDRVTEILDNLEQVGKRRYIRLIPNQKEG